MNRTNSRAVGAFLSGLLIVAPVVGIGISADALPLNPGVSGVTVTTEAPNFDVTIDCVQFLSSYSGLVAPARSGDTMTVHTVNCANFFFDVTTPYPIGNPPGFTAEMTGLGGEGTWNADFWFNPNNPVAPLPEEFTLTAGTFIYIDNADNTAYKPIDFHAVANLDDPSGERVYSQVGRWSASSPEFTIVDGSWNHYLNGDNTCRLRSGTHVYDEIPITITSSGEFTFRFVDSSPRNGALYNWLDDNPIRDSFIALYSTFDPANPDANVVGCNDDLNGEYTYADQDYWMFIDSEGNILYSHYPQFTSNLTPGEYTLVMTQYEVIHASDWTTTPYADSSGTFEMWGPADGFDIPEYSLTFDSQGGTACDPVTESLDVPLELPLPTRDGYVFDGWFTEPIGGDPAPNGSLMPEPVVLTLYAHWTVDSGNSASGELAATGSRSSSAMVFAVLSISASVGILVYRRRSQLR